MKIDGNAVIRSDNSFGSQNEMQVKRVTEELQPMQMQDGLSGENPYFPGEKQLIDAIEKSNKGFSIAGTSLKFSIHEKTKQILVKVVDNETKEVLREIPPEKILDMVAEMLERTGLFVDRKA